MKNYVAILPGETSIKEAIQQIEKSRSDSGFVLDGEGRYRGTISISDLRRLIIQ